MKQGKLKQLCSLMIATVLLICCAMQFATPAKTVKAEEAVATLKEAVPQYNPEKHKKIEITGVKCISTKEPTWEEGVLTVPVEANAYFLTSNLDKDDAYYMSMTVQSSDAVNLSYRSGIGKFLQISTVGYQLNMSGNQWITATAFAGLKDGITLTIYSSPVSLKVWVGETQVLDEACFKAGDAAPGIQWSNQAEVTVKDVVIWAKGDASMPVYQANKHNLISNDVSGQCFSVEPGQETSLELISAEKFPSDSEYYYASMLVKTEKVSIGFGETQDEDGGCMFVLDAQLNQYLVNYMRTDGTVVSSDDSTGDGEGSGTEDSGTTNPEGSTDTNPEGSESTGTGEETGGESGSNNGYHYDQKLGLMKKEGIRIAYYSGPDCFTLWINGVRVIDGKFDQNEEKTGLLQRGKAKVSIANTWTTEGLSGAILDNIVKISEIKVWTDKEAPMPTDTVQPTREHSITGVVDADASSVVFDEDGNFDVEAGKAVTVNTNLFEKDTYYTEMKITPATVPATGNLSFGVRVGDGTLPYSLNLAFEEQAYKQITLYSSETTLKVWVDGKQVMDERYDGTTSGSPNIQIMCEFAAKVSDCAVWAEGLARFAGTQLTLGGNIGMNFHVYAGNDGPTQNAEVRMLLPSGNVKVQNSADADAEYGVYCGEVPAKDMTQTVYAAYVDGDWESEIVECTVRDNAVAILENKENNEDYEVAQPLAKAMLNYGAYAQIYFGHDTENLANDDYTYEYDVMDNVTVDTLSEYKAVQSWSVEEPINGWTTVPVYESTMDKAYSITKISGNYSYNEDSGLLQVNDGVDNSVSIKTNLPETATYFVSMNVKIGSDKDSYVNIGTRKGAYVQLKDGWYAFGGMTDNTYVNEPKLSEINGKEIKVTVCSTPTEFWIWIGDDLLMKRTYSTEDQIVDLSIPSNRGGVEITDIQIWRGTNFANVKSSNLFLKSQTILQVYFNDAELLENLEFYLDGQTMAKKPEIDKNRYRVDVRDISAENLDKTYRIKVKSTKGYVLTAKYGVFTYGYNVLKNATTKDSLKNVIKSMWLYNSQAKRYKDTFVTTQ